MNHSRILPIVGMIFLVAIAAVGCGPQASIGQPVPTSTPCFRADLTKIRTSAAKTKISPEAVSAIPKDLIMSTDAQSFITLVRVADLTAAGMNTNDWPQDQQVLFIVNHGTWDWSSLVGQPTVVNWILFGLDPETYEVIIRVMTPDSPCFIG